MNIRFDSRSPDGEHFWLPPHHQNGWQMKCSKCGAIGELSFEDHIRFRQSAGQEYVDLAMRLTPPKEGCPGTPDQQLERRLQTIEARLDALRHRTDVQ